MSSKRNQLLELVRKRGFLSVPGHTFSMSSIVKYFDPISRQKPGINIEFILDDTFQGALVSKDVIRLYSSFDHTHSFNREVNEWIYYVENEEEDDPVFVYDYTLFEDCVHDGEGVIVDWDEAVRRGILDLKEETPPEPFSACLYELKKSFQKQAKNFIEKGNDKELVKTDTNPSYILAERFVKALYTFDEHLPLPDIIYTFVSKSSDTTTEIVLRWGRYTQIKFLGNEENGCKIVLTAMNTQQNIVDYSPEILMMISEDVHSEQ